MPHNVKSLVIITGTAILLLELRYLVGFLSYIFLTMLNTR